MKTWQGYAWLLALALGMTGLAPGCSDDDDDDGGNDDDDVATTPDDDDDDTTCQEEACGDGLHWDAASCQCLHDRLVPVFDDHKLRVAMGEADISPVIVETFTDANKDGNWGKVLPFHDLNGDKIWQAGEPLAFIDQNGNETYDRGEPLEDPETSPSEDLVKSKEPYDDVNANGKFDAHWIANEGGVPAKGLNDPIMAMVTVFAYDDEYVAFASLDVYGMVGGRAQAMSQMLDVEGFDGRRLIVNSNHNHRSSDTLGISGENAGSSGVNPEYMAFLEEAIVELVKETVTRLEPVTVYGGRMRLRDYDPWLTSVTFGGLNPKLDKQIGMDNDIRDPILVDDWVSTMQFKREEDGSVLGTFVNWSGHPEVFGGENDNLLSSDYPNWLRERLKSVYGGLVHFAIGDCGGMQSALGAWIPALDGEGNFLMEDDGNGGQQPVLLKNTSAEFARSNGYILADAVVETLDANPDPLPVTGLSVQQREVLLPLDNAVLFAGVMAGIVDPQSAGLMRDKEECEGEFACAPAHIWMVRLEPSVAIGTVPGELVPELFLGLSPADGAEDFDDPRPNRWFPQHNPDQKYLTHADPFVLPPPIIEQMEGEKLNFLIGLAESEFGYMVPEADFQDPGLANNYDHYEETLSLGPRTGTIVSETLRDLGANSGTDRIPTAW